MKYKEATSQSCFEKIFENYNLDWKAIYILPRIATVDTTIQELSWNFARFAIFLL